MSDDGVQITFSDDELYGEGNTEEVKDVQEPTEVVEEKAEAEAEPEASEDTKSDDSEQKSEEVNDLPKTDAELAEAHGVSEEEIRYAKNMGWSPKESFHGNPKDWKGPKEFIDVAEQSTPILRDRLREMSKKVTEMQKAFPTILEMQKRELLNRVDSLSSENERLQKDLEDAHLMADSKKAAELTEKIMENKLKMALTEEEKKHVGDKDGVAKLANQDKVIVPDGIDVERELYFLN